MGAPRASVAVRIAKLLQRPQWPTPTIALTRSHAFGRDNPSTRLVATAIVLCQAGRTVNAVARLRRPVWPLPTVELRAMGYSGSAIWVFETVCVGGLVGDREPPCSSRCS
jgi:hypothetical protein